MAGVMVRLCCEPRALYRSCSFRAIGRKNLLASHHSSMDLCVPVQWGGGEHTLRFIKQCCRQMLAPPVSIINVKAVLDHEYGGIGSSSCCCCFRGAKDSFTRELLTRPLHCAVGPIVVSLQQRHISDGRGCSTTKGVVVTTTTTTTTRTTARTTHHG